jgi:hypothetical protein
MKRITQVIVLLVFVFTATSMATTAYAMDLNQDAQDHIPEEEYEFAILLYKQLCLEDGGTWNAGVCTFPPGSGITNEFCGKGESLKFNIALFVYYLFEIGHEEEIPDEEVFLNEIVSCTGAPIVKTVPVSGGATVDAWIGNCGTYIVEAPVDGNLLLSKLSKHTKGFPDFIKDPCKITYFDSEGDVVENYGGFAWLYFNLDQSMANKWEKGELVFYYYNDGGWQACGNPSFVEAGEHGRIACLAERPTKFGIGY